MSAFTEYAAYTERNTSVNRNTGTDLLGEFEPTNGEGFPVSGDMLAVLASDTRTRQYRRRLAFGRAAAEVEL